MTNNEIADKLETVGAGFMKNSPRAGLLALAAERLRESQENKAGDDRILCIACGHKLAFGEECRCPEPTEPETVEYTVRMTPKALVETMARLSEDCRLRIQGNEAWIYKVGRFMDGDNDDQILRSLMIPKVDLGFYVTIDWDHEPEPIADCPPDPGTPVFFVGKINHWVRIGRAIVTSNVLPGRTIEIDPRLQLDRMVVSIDDIYTDPEDACDAAQAMVTEMLGL